MRRIAVLAALGVVSTLGAAPPSGTHVSTAEAAVAAAYCSAEAEMAATSRTAEEAMAAPADADPTSYYAVDLVTTKNIPATARAHGTGHVTFAPSPFGVALSPNGSYVYDVRLQLQEISRPSSGALVGWITTPEVDRIERLGAFDEDLSVSGTVAWNKYLVVVTLEDTDDPGAKTWSGPIVLRGMSRSGAMHTMAGHGPFQQELCAKYGYR
jgi:hypothetical protein